LANDENTLDPEAMLAMKIASAKASFEKACYRSIS